jgi:hypothetical protein
MAKKIIVTEQQLTKIFEEIAGSEIIKDKETVPVRYPIDPNKVLLVKKCLDDYFKPGLLNGADLASGLPGQQQIICMFAQNGEKISDMSFEDVEDRLIENFKNMFLNPDERKRFIKQVIRDWYDGRISPYGLLSVNYV